MSNFYKREIEDRVKSINESFRVLAITGPRQVGKSTILENLKKEEMEKVSLDDLTLRQYAQNDPNLFLQTYKSPLFIDEVQYAPQLFPYIKINVDKNKERGQYWLSGSQIFELMKGITESLAGRVGLIKLYSFTYREIKQNITNKVFDLDNLVQREHIDIKELFKLIFKGGMPELYDYPNMNRQDFFESYIDTYIDKDVRQIKDIGNLENFKKFMTEMAIRVGTTLNYSDIAKDIGVSVNTVKSWVSILSSTGIIYLLPAYANSKIDRLTKMPKIIFMDMGLCSYLAGWESSTELEKSIDSGRYLESYIISEIIKQYSNFGKNVKLYHFRKADNNEIDLIMIKNMTIYPIEIKKTASPNKKMISNFSILTKTKYKIGKGGLICCYDKLMPIDDTNYIIPISSVINP